MKSVAHHLNSWMDNMDQRYNLNNGVCICEKCHAKFHNGYGWGHNSKQQYENFKEREYHDNKQ